ncbi:MAG: hypothetical protein RL219_1739 [Actinomycetota bacterium]
MSAATPTSQGPVIASSSIGPGHDGRAEVVVELLYPNGGRNWISIGEDSLLRALDAAGVASLEELNGQPWTRVLAGLDLPGVTT